MRQLGLRKGAEVIRTEVRETVIAFPVSLNCHIHRAKPTFPARAVNADKDAAYILSLVSSNLGSFNELQSVAWKVNSELPRKPKFV